LEEQEDSYPKFTYMLVRRSQLVGDFEGFCSLLSGDLLSSCACVPLHRVTRNMRAGFFREHKREKEGE
jgi:hypothetical protein